MKTKKQSVIPKIDKGIAIPPIHRPRRKSKWDIIFDKWRVGDSFEIAIYARKLINNIANRRGQEITSRLTKPGIIRIWRTK